MRVQAKRVLQAKGRMKIIVDAMKAMGLVNSVERQTELIGWTDAVYGRHTLPKMFVGEADLTRYWECGQREFASSLDKHAWRQRCDQMSARAFKQCNLSFDDFAVHFSAAVDLALEKVAAADQAEALGIARQFGYASVKERALTDCINRAVDDIVRRNVQGYGATQGDDPDGGPAMRAVNGGGNRMDCDLN